MTLPLEPATVAAAFITHWLSVRFGSIEDLGTRGGSHRWRVRQDPQTHCFLVDVADDAMGDLDLLRHWLEAVAEDARSNAPEPTAQYVVSASEGAARIAADGTFGLPGAGPAP